MKNQLGGLARRATYIEQQRAAGIPVLHLEAGDAFHKGYNVADKDKKQVGAAADLFLQQFAAQGLHAYNLGDRDLGLGMDTLLALSKKAKFPILNANVLKDGTPVFKPSAIVEVAGYQIGLVGAVTALFVNKTQLEQDSGVTLAAPAPLVKAEVDKLKAAGISLIFVLGHLNAKEMEAVAAASPDITAILGGQSNLQQRTLKMVEGVFVADAYQKGKNLSVLDLFVRGGSLKFVDRYRRKSLETLKANLDRQVQSRAKSIEQAKKDPVRARSVEYLERNLVQLRTQLQEVEFDLEDAVAPVADASFVKWELKGMSTSFVDEANSAAAVKAYRDVYPDPTKKKRPAPVPPKR
ncbi:MAG: 2',3'-cyclic-nucleotide 2'-phosphodiesterase (5'-nucleotidase family) [Myxococcota bacterium]